MEQPTPQEYVRVPHRLTASWSEPAGVYVNRFFLKIRDKTELWAMKCPTCGSTIAGIDQHET